MYDREYQRNLRIVAQKKTAQTLTQYVFADGIFTFWCAEYGSIDNDIKIIFRVRADTSPMNRAEYKLPSHNGRYILIPANNDLIAQWILTHSYRPVIGMFKDIDQLKNTVYDFMA